MKLIQSLIVCIILPGLLFLVIVKNSDGQNHFSNDQPKSTLRPDTTHVEYFDDYLKVTINFDRLDISPSMLAISDTRRKVLQNTPLSFTLNESINIHSLTLNQILHTASIPNIPADPPQGKNSSPKFTIEVRQFITCEKDEKQNIWDIKLVTKSRLLYYLDDQDLRQSIVNADNFPIKGGPELDDWVKEQSWRKTAQVIDQKFPEKKMAIESRARLAGGWSISTVNLDLSESVQLNHILKVADGSINKIQIDLIDQAITPINTDEDK